MPENNVNNPITEDTGQSRLHPSRDQVLDRLWEIANLAPEITRGSLTGQVKALSLIVAIEGLIPDRRAASARNNPAPPPVTAEIYEAEWLRNQRSAKIMDPEPTPPPLNGPTPGPTGVTEPIVVAAPVNPSQNASLAPRVPMADYFVPDTRVPLAIKKNRFGPRR
jgi:hypothetical protein